jgi:catechol 2,3-dioxygenase-like lactoylglutathione lyase family enzyme
MITGIDHGGLTVRDMDQALAFYRDLLGFKVVADAPYSGEGISAAVGLPNTDLRAVWVKVAERDYLELIEYKNVERREVHPRKWDLGATHICFHVDDCWAAYEDLVKKGVKFTSPPVESTEGDLAGELYAYFEDPDGNILEIEQCNLPG